MVVLKCDITVAGDVTDALSAAGSAVTGLPPIRGVFHAACPPQAKACGKEKSSSNAGVEANPLPLNVDRRFLEAKVSSARDYITQEIRGLPVSFCSPTHSREAWGPFLHKTYPGIYRLVKRLLRVSIIYFRDITAFIPGTSASLFLTLLFTIRNRRDRLGGWSAESFGRR